MPISFMVVVFSIVMFSFWVVCIYHPLSHPIGIGEINIYILQAFK